MLKIYTVSLGCPKNRVDTEKFLGGLQAFAGGVEPVESPAEADLVFVNTCGFIAPAVQESLQSILELGREIGERQGGRRPLFVVGGCMVGRYKAKNLAPDLPEVDLWLETKDLPNWGDLAARRLGLSGPPAQTSIRVPDPALGGARLLSTGPSYAWLKVSEGCSQRCAFCTIPSIRGPLVSRPAADVLREAQELLRGGVRELVLVAQDLTAWGRDRGERAGLPGLLEKLLPLEGLARLRLMYLYPAGLTDALLSFMRQAGPPLLPYFDVPLQHAHPDILRAMGRPFARSPYKVLERIRRHFPEAAVRSTLIAGFPGEKKEHFLALKEFVRQSRFHHLGVFTYQAEEGTRAATLSDPVARRTAERRRASIMELQAGISSEIMQSCLGQEMEILVDGPSDEWPGLYQGRVWFQAPEVDGLTYVSGEGATKGTLACGRISGVHTYDLEALL